MARTKKRTKKETGHMRILKETPEKWVKLDVEMDDTTINLLVGYAEKTMSATEKSELLVNWAFLDILRKQIGRKK